jgi:hypothetical protein
MSSRAGKSGGAAPKADYQDDFDDFSTEAVGEVRLLL